MSSADDQATTPLLKQYYETKAKAGDAILFFRMGDFYEFFGDDAVTAARLLEINLTSRDKNKPNPLPMAGVPYHAAQSYIQRLLKAGYKVAIAEQTSMPQKVAGAKAEIATREIVRTFTPAVQFEQESAEATYLATLIKNASTFKAADSWSACLLDPSTGDLLTSTELGVAQIVDLFESFPIKHLLCIEHNSHLPEGLTEELKAREGFLFESLPSNAISLDRARQVLTQAYQILSLENHFESNELVLSSAILVQYVTKTQGPQALAHLRFPRPLIRSDRMVLGPRTAAHLDLFATSEQTPNLFQFLNKTQTALGARELRRWIAEPLLDLGAIHSRQESLKAIGKSRTLRDSLAKHLSQIYDLERICGRVNAKLANPRDTLALARSLHAIESIDSYLIPLQSPDLEPTLAKLKETTERTKALSDEILRTQKDDAPLISREGQIFSSGTHPELDRLIDLSQNGERWLIDLEQKERARTGIGSLKVKYNRVFGYFIEVTQTHLKQVPADYQRKQTTVGGERFFTTELKQFEEEILTASSRQKSLEQELFEKLIERIQAATPEVMKLAKIVAELDTVTALAAFVGLPGWSFPEISKIVETPTPTAGPSLLIEKGRHPLVDEAMRGRFVANSLSLANPESLMIITGPNMGGKSTVMRQTALIVILGQMGALIPAKAASWTLVTSLFTRIGAHDSISKGQSTFMVEMAELAHILHQADKNSLIILDEIGRGTSTYDGMSVAWATLEWIAHHISARTLFATHYHELTVLDKDLPQLTNSHMAVEGTRESKSTDLRFLYELRKGPASESFGIQVARLAGLPAPVIERAWSVLEKLEENSQAVHDQAATRNPLQLSFFEFLEKPGTPITQEAKEVTKEIVREVVKEIVVPHPMLTEITELNLNEMSPIQALNELARIQSSLSKKSTAN